MAITTKHFFARNGMFSQSGSHIVITITKSSELESSELESSELLDFNGVVNGFSFLCEER